jgi:predicted nucleic-acid-binding protein
MSGGSGIGAFISTYYRPRRETAGAPWSTGIAEFEWVLESVYRASRSDVVAAVRMLQTTPPFVLEDAELVDRALRMYSKGKGDLSDYILGEIASARGARTTYTFDRDLRSAEGFTLL